MERAERKVATAKKRKPSSAPVAGAALYRMLWKMHCPQKVALQERLLYYT